MSGPVTLTQSDVDALVNNPSVDVKIELTEKISQHYNDRAFDDKQVAIAEQIFVLLSKHAEAEVRKALSESLKSNTDIPHDLAMLLAKDVGEVAVPMLQYSQLLSDDDLIEIIKVSSDVAAYLAIANRNVLSPHVSQELIETKHKRVTEELLRNQSAMIHEAGLKKVVTLFPKEQRVIDALVTRINVPDSVVMHMVQLVGISIQEALADKYGRKFEEINRYFSKPIRKTAVKLVSPESIDEEVINIIDMLEKRGTLNSALEDAGSRVYYLVSNLEKLGHFKPFNALAMGHLALFIISMSRLAEISYANAKRLTLDRAKGLPALYSKAQLPADRLPTVQYIYDIVMAMEAEHKGDASDPRAWDDRNAYLQRVIDGAKGKQLPDLGRFISLIRDYTRFSGDA